MTPLLISSFTATSCIGTGLAATRASLHAGSGGLAPCHFDDVRLATWAGEVAGLDELAFPTALASYDCRNNRLALLGLQQDGFLAAVAACAARHGPERVGVILDTSTSGILSTEHAYRRRDPAAFAELVPSIHDHTLQSLVARIGRCRRHGARLDRGDPIR